MSHFDPATSIGYPDRVLRNGLRAIARAAYRGIGHYPVTVRGTKLKVDPYHLGFWRDLGGGTWEPSLLQFLEDHLSRDSTFLDLGAWIGPATLFAARRCRRVFAVEPDPAAYRHLLWNLELNGIQNAMPFQVAIGEETGLRRLDARGERLGDSKSTLLPGDGGGAETEVVCLSWGDWLALAGQPRIDCLKIDIEGGEFEVLPAIREYLISERPTLHLSLHVLSLPQEQRGRTLEAAMEALRVYRTVRDERGGLSSPSNVAEEARLRDCAFVFTA